MQISELFIFDVIPLTYWIGITIIVCAIFFMVYSLNQKSSQVIFIFMSILLMIAFRMVFPISFTSIVAFEPDVAYYMDLVNSWTITGIDFGIEGQISS